MLGLYEIDKHIRVMCIIGGILALSALLFNPLDDVAAIVILVVIPLGCCLMFWFTEHPGFGIAYTALFFLTRIPAFFIGAGTLLAAIIVISLLIYFIYVDYLCIYRDREILRHEAEEIIKRHEESKNDNEQEENHQFFNWPEN